MTLSSVIIFPPVAFANETDEDTHTMSHRLISFVKKTVNDLRYTSYKFGGTYFNTVKGIYILDCSAYIDRLLQKIYPHAYSNLVNTVGAEKPTTKHYYDFFSNLDNETNPFWNKIENVALLQPGDIIVFRKKSSYRATTSSGHVMVVMNHPIRDASHYLVRVADSAPSAHSEDTRRSKKSGIGIGTLLLKTNPKTGEPSAYAWTLDSYWTKNVIFAMARPLSVELAV